jgi:hypothetical protein
MIKKSLREGTATSSPNKNGRYNKTFKMETPHITDPSIKDLIKKYPIKPHGADDDGEANNYDEEAIE